MARITASQFRTARQTRRLFDALREDHAADDAGIPTAVLAHTCALTTARARHLLCHLERRGLAWSVWSRHAGRATQAWRLGRLGRPRADAQGDTT